MPDMMSAVDIANEFREEMVRLDAAAVDVMLNSWQGVEQSLLVDMERFAARFTDGQSLTPGQVLRMRRFNELYAQVEAQLRAMEAAAGPVVTAGQAQAAQLGALQAATTLESLGAGAAFNALPVSATQNVVALARAGKPLAELLQPMYGQAAEGIIRELINGVALGRGPRAIARAMARDGMTDALNHLLLVTRDQYNRAHRAAAQQRYEESGVVMGYVRRCARQAGRTCIACIALDGTFYELDEPFAEHPQGRCTQIPAIRGVEWKSRLGSGKSWFENLPMEEQIATMGRGRWEAWQAGELPWDKMAVRTDHPVWGPGVRVANVPDGFKKVKKAKANPLQQRLDNVRTILSGRGTELHIGSELDGALMADIEDAARELVALQDKYGVPVRSVSFTDLSGQVNELSGGGVAGRASWQDIVMGIDAYSPLPYQSYADLVNNMEVRRQFLEQQLVRMSGRETSLGYQQVVRQLKELKPGVRTSLGGSPADVMTHEYGHILHWTKTFKPNAAGFISGPGDAEWIFREELEAAIKTHGDIISTYAQYNHKEMFAETFLAYERGEDLPADLLRIIEGVIND